ncbi:hypothetical protein NV226_01655 [Mycoplasma iguanae]|uniref:Asp23/Gls24 family envelope stress response protein n=1 Tax=Mycoplasma iguanae TaxID=292461 RepID=A0ABY5R908_9MOLU|nr:hypothetical protein [Mycoplasma iguanae]UVD81994.1 hypothetical protein NV226_01655 [Mycoplasma iguanae]
MQYILLNYGLNKSYNIHQNVFVQVINNSLNAKKEIELIDEPIVSFVEQNTNVEIFINIKIKIDLDIIEIINHLTTSINEDMKNLIGVAPKNIQINYQGRF